MMGSSTRSCEIVESKDELSSNQNYGRFRQTRMQDRNQKPPFPKGMNKVLENEINKLFEAIDLRTTRSLDLSDRIGTGLSRKNPAKKPMRVGGSQSPGIGVSEPKSLKQALRGLSISHAAEMATTKRLSKPPVTISEAGKVSSAYRSVVLEAHGSGYPLTEGKEGRVQGYLVPEEGSSSSSSKVSQYIQEPKSASASANPSGHSSPRLVVKATAKNVESALRLNQIVPAPIQVEIQSLPAQEETHIFVPSLPCMETKMKSRNYSTWSSPRLHQSAHSSPRLLVKPTIKGVESTPKEHEILTASIGVEVQSKTVRAPKEHQASVPSVPSHNTDLSLTNKGKKSPSKHVVNSVRVMTKATPKLRRKGRLRTLQSANTTKSNKDSKSIKSTSRAGKPARNAVKKKEKHDSTSAASASDTSDEENGIVDSTSQLICQKCRCHLKDVKNELTNNDPAPIPVSIPPEVSASNRNYALSKLGFVSNSRDNASVPAVKFKKMSRSREQGTFSQSSQSSIGEYSSSTTISEQSNLSGSSCGNRPHMSKDFRWEAINKVRKQHGFLGLVHFNLLEKLGSGDIGTVYLAELIGMSCLFAMKVMDNEFLVKRRKITRAQTEREILRMLDHPFLPTLYAQFTSDNLSCLVMEFCPGGDLHVLRQKQPDRYFPEHAARFYVAEVLLALEYLHMLGIVYRDLKPENIMVREDGHIMLTDFDLSLRCSVSPTLVKSPLVAEPPRISGPCAGSNCIDPFCTGPSCKVSCFSPRLLSTTSRARKLKAELATQARLLPQLVAEPTEARSYSFVGTHEYLAPEIIKGEVHGSAVDWWTLGVFLYELLYGKTPFKGAGNEETLANVVLQGLKFPNSPLVSFQARDLIRGLLVKEPENRFGTETGAAEIKRHPFFDGLNWALIRCAIPPEMPELSDIGVMKMVRQGKGKRFLEYRSSGEHLEFDLF